MTSPILEMQAVVNQLSLAGGIKSHAAKALGIPESTFKDRLAKAEEMGIKPEFFAPDVELQISKLKQEHADVVTKLRAQLREANRQEYTAESWRTFLWGLSSKKATPPQWLFDEVGTESSPGIPTLFLSDFHWGESVTPDQVNGINEYNMSIAHDRLMAVTQNTIDLCFNHMVNPDYPGLVLALGGDMFSGEIHPELVASNESHVMVALLDLFNNMVASIDLLLEYFDKIFVPTAFGNHGRMTQKMWFKDAAFTNFDWVLYNMLDNHYKEDPRIQFKVTNSFDTYYEVAGVRYLLTHGDRIGSGGGDGVVGAIAPIVRGMVKLQNQYASIGKKVDYVLMGHWHQLMLGIKNGIVNGTIKGFDEYALGRRFAPEEPTQALWFTHPERGMTFRTPVFAEASSQLTQSNAWVLWEE